MKPTRILGQIRMAQMLVRGPGDPRRYLKALGFQFLPSTCNRPNHFWKPLELEAGAIVERFLEAALLTILS